MTGRGHTHTGWAISPFCFFVVFHFQSFTLSFLSLVFCVLFATAPDWLEIQKRVKLDDGKYAVKTLIPHRTITHIVLIWVVALCTGYKGIASDVDGFVFDYLPSLNPLFASILFGCGVGGLIHLLFDLPNYKPIPFFTLWDRVGLRLWPSGKFEKTLTVFTVFLSVGLLNYFYANVTGQSLKDMAVSFFSF